jgi:hypothetical protein
VEVVMAQHAAEVATEVSRRQQEPEQRSEGRRALIEVTPEVMAKLRNPKVVLAIALALTGAVAEFIGYWGVSGTLDPGKQLPYLVSGGIGGLFLLGAAAALLFSSDVGGVRQEVTDVHDLVESLAAEVRELRAELEAARAQPPSRARTRRSSTKEP